MRQNNSFYFLLQSSLYFMICIDLRYCFFFYWYHKKAYCLILRGDLCVQILHQSHLSFLSRIRKLKGTNKWKHSTKVRHLETFLCKFYWFNYGLSKYISHSLNREKRDMIRQKICHDMQICWATNLKKFYVFCFKSF